MSQSQKVDGTIVAELVAMELEVWRVGVCSILYNPEKNEIVVRGENGHIVGRADCDVWKEAEVIEGDVIDVAQVAEEVNSIIEEEMSRL